MKVNNEDENYCLNLYNEYEMNSLNNEHEMVISKR